jgi:hypothetical protein
LQNSSVQVGFEIYSDSVVTQSQTFSGLVGAIWQVNDKLAFDAAVRYASVDGRPVSELPNQPMLNRPSPGLGVGDFPLWILNPVRSH